MKGHGEKLSRKQEALISALLLTPTLAEAAHRAGIGEVTAWRWLKLEVVQTAYRAARREVVWQAIAQLQYAAGHAVTTLCAVMHDATAPASARVSAAKVVLELAIKAVETEDLAVRLTVLEVQQAALGPQQQHRKC